MNKVIITGATGIIGVALTELCLQKGTHVLAVVRPRSKYLSRLPKHKNKLQILECDLSNISYLPEMTEGGFDTFYHLGWTAKGRFWRENTLQQTKDIDYTLQAVTAAKKLGCKVFLGAGSQAEYGNQIHKMPSNASVNPNTAYGVAKFAAGKLSSILCAELGIKHVWARIYSTYGPNDSRNSMIMYAIEKLLHGEKPSFTPCEQYWDYLYCTDTAKALYLLGMYGENQSVYNIGSGHALPLHKYIKVIRDTINSELPLGIGEKNYSEKQVMYLCADIEKLMKDTGFKPEISFDEGIKLTITWYKKEFLRTQQ